MSIYILYTSYVDTKQQIKTRFSNNSLLIAERIKAGFQASDYVLRDIISQVSLSELQYPPTNTEKHQQRKEFIEKKRLTLPHATLAGLYDKNCILTHTNHIDGFDGSKREYCQVMQNEPKRKTFISQAFVSDGGLFNVVQVRKFNTKSGFLGMAAFGIDLSYFTELIDLPQETKLITIRMFDKNMRLIANKPFVLEDIGTISSEVFIKEFIESSDRVRFIDGLPSLYKKNTMVYLRKVDELPFIIVMEMTSKDGLAGWYRHALIIFFFLFSILLMTIAIIKNNLKIIEQNKILVDKEKKLHLLATTDSLTGLLNRHGIKSLVEQEMKRFNRKKYPVSLILIDIDNFKVINDNFGHPIGDKILQLLSNSLQPIIRDADYIVRWGGEEFFILATDTPLANATILAEKIRALVEGLSQAELPPFTVSIGVAQYKKQDSFDNWYTKADNALYKAKEDGKNQVAVANDNPLIL